VGADAIGIDGGFPFFVEAVGDIGAVAQGEFEAQLGVRPGDLVLEAEAVGDLYTSALIELGLILFFITFVVLAIARYMLMRIEQKSA